MLPSFETTDRRAESTLWMQGNAGCVAKTAGGSAPDTGHANLAPELRSSGHGPRRLHGVEGS